MIEAGEQNRQDLVVGVIRRMNEDYGRIRAILKSNK